MNTQVPGIKAQHAIITKVCRANRTTDGAFDEAVARLRREYVACQNEANQEANFHLVLTVERLERASPVPEAPHGWQSISTAPTGNHAFLAWEPTHGSIRIVCQWPVGSFEVFPDARPWTLTPTYWMELPEAPVSREQEKRHDR